MSTEVTVVEVGPRDGLQNEDVIVATDDKIELISRSVAAGARRIEAVSFSHPRLVPQMADAEAVMAGVPRGKGVSYIGLVLNRRGLDRAMAAEVDEVNVVVVATDTFSKRNQNVTTGEMLDAWEKIAADTPAGVRKSVTIAAAFGCPFEGETPPERVAEIARRAAATGADEIALADTIGVGVPGQVRDLTRRVRAAAPGVPLRFHFHNTRNTGYANALTAVEEGVTVLDASAGGFGGCPFAPAATGNIATEDLLYALHRSGHVTGLDEDAVAATGAWLGGVLAKPVPGLRGRAGGFPARTERDS
ncbi:hydroxymethylglutaryl-CoA lyase [Actinocorallia sp. A-T 12471]|uniref:hydroxymethylglutaryl-CoA lyase n=1 Tax=Actinocorallia sp. A-T 12471 TaxID=3089813 RepID=UPI0029CD2AEE|nr:hydroxymethylglutaryl-CoA lyase [Actinocorallia sp. A-T 12471]MDX6744384.1 hydroxymethylglutaryl-CoA lyase [Actinocorallia sp. A-T 12471]